MAISPSSSAWRIRSTSTLRIRALVCALSVRIRTWVPVKERASAPRAWMASERSPMETCSPVARITSSSRSSGASVISYASIRRRSVSPAMAETTTTTSFPASRVSTIRRATCRIRPTSPTEVPPYFWTMSPTSFPPGPHRDTETELPPKPGKVVDAGDDAEDDGDADGQAAQTEREAGKSRGARIKHQQDHGDHFRDHLVFAQLGRGDDQALGGGNAPQSGDGDVPPDDDGRDPRRHPLNLDEGNERRRDQQLVGDRIQELAQGRHLPATPGDAAVQPVGQDRRDKNRRRGVVAGLSVGDQENHEEGDEEDPNQAQRIWQIH